MADTPVVAVVGVRALMRDVNKLCANAGDLNRAMSQAGRAAAAPVAARVRSTVPHSTGRLASSVRVGATRSGASVRMGSSAVPYAGPVDFGGYPAGREYVANGRYLFPAAAGQAEHVAQLYADAVQKALDHFNWTNETTNPESVHD